MVSNFSVNIIFISFIQAISIAHL